MLNLQGQDSVAAAVAFNLYHLATNPDAQDKAFQELSEIFGDSERTANIEDLNRMKYLEQCLKETMRLCPSVPLIARKLSEDVKLGRTLDNDFIVSG